MIADIDSPFQVVLQMAFEDRRTEEFRIILCAGAQRFYRQVAQRSAQPVMRGNVEADLGPVQDGRWQLIAHQLLQNNLLPRA